MADKLTTENEVLIDFLFIDGDTRRQSLKNPTDVTTSQITALETFILNGGQSTLLVGDRTGAQFRRINKVTNRTTLTLNLDLTT